MTFQWGENPEYIAYLYFQPHFVALPFQINWYYGDAGTGKNYSLSFHFLCFGFSFEIWRWKK